MPEGIGPGSKFRFIILITSGKPMSPAGVLSRVEFLVPLALVFRFARSFSEIDASYSCPTGLGLHLGRGPYGRKK